MADPENVADNTSQDVVITDEQLFDHAIAPDPAPTPPTVEIQGGGDQPGQTGQSGPSIGQPASQPAAGELPRDPQGRFAKTPAQKPQAAPQQQPQRTPEDHRVPLRELLDERERRQRIEAEAHQMRQAWAQFQAQQQAAAQQQQAPQTIFDAPEDYLTQRVIEPLRQEMQMEALKNKEQMSREVANHQFGQQAVNAALADMTRVRWTPQGDLAYRQIMSAGHPYGGTHAMAPAGPRASGDRP